MKFQFDNKTYTISRYPHSNNRSLQPWSAADEHILKYIEEEHIEASNSVIYNDSFGFLGCTLNNYNPISVFESKTQEKAFIQNQKDNGLSINIEKITNPLHTLNTTIDLGIIKIPKSVDLFKLFLHHISQSIHENGVVLCSFMTKHFTPQLISASEEYFNEVGQTKAWKKSRIIVLKSPKKSVESNIINTIKWKEDKVFKQYYGVFSAQHIDYASQFLIENLEVYDDENEVLDLASGNGILAYEIQQKTPKSQVTLMDESYLAIQSSMLNVDKERANFIHNNTLEELPQQHFDLAVSNPPFHIGHENNIEISLRLFAEVKDCLNDNGRFVLVANKHLNYKTHLLNIFVDVKTVKENEKFVIYECK